MTKAPRRSKAQPQATERRDLPAALKVTAAISGEPKVGATLSCAVTIEGMKPLVFYQWMRGDLYIPNAEGSTYQVTPVDEGSEIWCKVVTHGEDIHSFKTNRMKIG